MGGSCADAVCKEVELVSLPNVENRAVHLHSRDRRRPFPAVRVPFRRSDPLEHRGFRPRSGAHLLKRCAIRDGTLYGWHLGPRACLKAPDGASSPRSLSTL